MNRALAIIGAVAALGVAGWLAAAAASSLYFTPRAALKQEVVDLQDSLSEVQSRLDNRSELDAALQSFVDRTLGPDQETVDHRLRTRLNRIAEELQLRGATVGTGDVATQRSPARSAFPRSASWRELRDTTDFVELGGWISGEGSLDKVLRLVDRIDAEPWMKHLDQVKLDVKDNGRRFAITVRLTTMFMPGREPREQPPAAYDEARLEPYAPLLASNPFRLPPRRQAEAPPPPPVSAPVPTFPWGDWILTGVADAPTGPEIWLRNHKTGETRRLSIGQSLDSALLIDIGPTWAEFSLSEERFRISVGKNLNDRTPAAG